MDCITCGMLAEQVIGAPLLVKAAQNVMYDSPITGLPITSWEAHREDLKRSGCRPYDPEMKKDAERFRKEKADELDKSIELHVEETVEKMPSAKRAKLASELIDQGIGADVVRTTA